MSILSFWFLKFEKDFLKFGYLEAWLFLSYTTRQSNCFGSNHKYSNIFNDKKTVVSKCIRISFWIFNVVKIWSNSLNKEQNQPLVDVLQNKCSWKFRNIHKKTPVLESVLKKFQASSLQLYQKINSSWGVFLWILRNF